MLPDRIGSAAGVIRWPVEPIESLLDSDQSSCCVSCSP
jgi:hypothetical protein